MGDENISFRLTKWLKSGKSETVHSFYDFGGSQDFFGSEHGYGQLSKKQDQVVHIFAKCKNNLLYSQDFAVPDFLVYVLSFLCVGRYQISPCFPVNVFQHHAFQIGLLVALAQTGFYGQHNRPMLFRKQNQIENYVWNKSNIFLLVPIWKGKAFLRILLKPEHGSLCLSRMVMGTQKEK